MAKIVKKTKSHGKPSISKTRYNESAKTIGIDIEAYGPRRPRPIMVYKIYCHYKRTLDHNKYHWAKHSKYANDSYDSRTTSDKVCVELEKLYSNWYFYPVAEFVDPTTQLINVPHLPIDIIYNINSGEETMAQKLNLQIKENTDAHKQQILKEAGIDDESETTVKKTTKKTKRTKK